MAKDRIEVLNDTENLANIMVDYQTIPNPKPILASVKGIIEFTRATFPKTDLDNVYAQLNEREPEGRGAHFDVYQDFVDSSTQWIAVYNLAGSVSLRTTVLPVELAKSYFDTFRYPTDEAWQARRHYSAIALTAPGAIIKTGEITPYTGLILPQRHSGPHIVHDIVPNDPTNPGRFVKLVVPNFGSAFAAEKIIEGDYKPLDALITQTLSGDKPEPQIRVDDHDSATTPTTIHVQTLGPVTKHGSSPRKGKCSLD